MTNSITNMIIHHPASPLLLRLETILIEERNLITHGSMDKEINQSHLSYSIYSLLLCQNSVIYRTMSNNHKEHSKFLYICYQRVEEKGKYGPFTAGDTNLHQNLFMV